MNKKILDSKVTKMIGYGFMSSHDLVVKEKVILNGNVLFQKNLGAY